MKNLLVVLLAVLFIAGTANAQLSFSQSSVYYKSTVVKNTTDTIPGTGNEGAKGKAGWYYVGDDNVSVLVSAMDSVNISFTIHYCDSGFVSATASSAKQVPHVVRARTVNEDSLFTKTPFVGTAAMGKVLRDYRSSTDLIPGGKWIRLAILATNADEQKLKSTGYAYRVRFNRWK